MSARWRLELDLSQRTSHMPKSKLRPARPETCTGPPNVESVDDSLELLVELDIEVISAAKDSPWGRRAVVRDLDGHTVELTTPLKG